MAINETSKNTYTKEEIKILQEWIEDKNNTINYLRERLQAREEEFKNVLQLLQNEQVKSMESLQQLKSTSQALLESSKKKKVGEFSTFKIR